MSFDPKKYGAKEVKSESTSFDPSKYGATEIATEKKNEPAPSVGAPVGSPSISAGTPPPVEKVHFDPNKVRGYETVLQQYAGIGQENANNITGELLGTIGGRMALATPTGGPMTLPSSYALRPEMVKKKAELQAQLKTYEAELNPKFDAAIKTTLGKFTTKDGQVDYGKIYTAAAQIAKNIGGGDYTKEIVAQKMIAAEKLNQMKPLIDQAANKVFKEKTGKTIDEFYKEKAAQLESEAIKEKTYVETQFANEQKAANERLQQRAKEDFENYYKPQLELAVEEEDYNSLVSQYVSSLKSMQAEENSRLKRLGQEMYRAANQKIEALSKKTNISDKEKAAIDEAYKVGYKTAVEQQFAGEAAKQQILAGLPGGKTTLAAKALYEGFNLWLSSAGAGLIGLGMNNGLTDWLRSKQETAERYKTTDIPLEGKNWFDPNAYTTRLMKQLGMQGIPMAATLLTRSPTLGATLGVASESIQIMGDTYNQVLQETGNPAQAEIAAQSVGANNAKMMPLYFMEADLFLKATKGGLFKGAATTLAQVPVEYAQEVGQGIAQESELGGRNFIKYLNEEGGELFKETAVLTILQQGAFGGIGDIYNTLGKNNKGASTQYILDIARKEGLAKAGAIAEQLALKGSLSEVELADTKELIGSITGDIEVMREAGANETQIQGYIANMAEADAIKKQEAQLSATSPVKQQLASKRMQLEQDAKKLVTGEGTTVTVTMPNGTVVGVPQANAAATIDGLSTQIADGQVTVQAEGENAAAVNEQVAAIQPATRRLQGRLKRTAPKPAAQEIGQKQPEVVQEVVAAAPSVEVQPKSAEKSSDFAVKKLTKDELDVYENASSINLNGEDFTFAQVKDGGANNVFVVEKDGVEIGKATLNKGGYFDNIRIDEKHRRKGLATKMYDYVESVTGKELQPSPIKQSPEAKKVWEKKRLKESVSKNVKGGVFAKALGGAMAKLLSDLTQNRQKLLELEDKFFAEKGITKDEYLNLDAKEQDKIKAEANEWLKSQSTAAAPKEDTPRPKSEKKSVEVQPKAAENKGIELSKSESFRDALKVLLFKPNSDASKMLRGEEKEVGKIENAFSYTTRGTKKETYPINIKVYESDKGKRYVAYDDDVIVAAAFVDNDNKITGVITENGFENVGIGTNLVKAIKAENKQAEFDGIVSKQGKKLIDRVEAAAPKEDTPQVPKIETEKGNFIQRDLKAEKIRDDKGHRLYKIRNKDGKELGNVSVNERDDLGGYQVESVSVYEKNKGVGKDLYKALIKSLDKPLISDSSITAEAKGLWESLVKDGVAKFDKEKGKYVSVKNQAETKKEAKNESAAPAVSKPIQPTTKDQKPAAEKEVTGGVQPSTDSVGGGVSKTAASVPVKAKSEYNFNNETREEDIVIGSDIAPLINEVESKAKSLPQKEFDSYFSGVQNQLWEAAKPNPYSDQSHTVKKVFDAYFRSMLPKDELYVGKNVWAAISGALQKRNLVSKGNVTIKAINEEVVERIDKKGLSILNALAEFTSQKYPEKSLGIAIGSQPISVAGADGFRMTPPDVESDISDMFPYWSGVIPAYQELEKQGVDRRVLWAAHDFLHELGHTLGLIDEKETDKFAVESVKEFAKFYENKSKPKPPAEGAIVDFPAKKGEPIRYFYKDGAWHFLDSRGREQKEVEGKQQEITDYFVKVTGDNKTLADKIRTAKVKTDKAFDATLGLPVAVWNAAVEVVATAVETGVAIFDAAKRGLDYIKANHEGDWNEGEYDTRILKELGVKREELYSDLGQQVADIMKDFPDATLEEIMVEVEDALPELVASPEIRKETEERVQAMMTPEPAEQVAKDFPKGEKRKSPEMKAEQMQGDRVGNGERIQSLIQRAIGASNLSEKIKQGFKDAGTGLYKVADLKEATNIAKAIVKELGRAKALDAAISGVLDGDVSSAIYAVSLNEINAEQEAATEPAHKEALMNEWADLYADYSEKANYMGKFNSYIGQMIKSNPYGLVRKVERDYQRIIDAELDARAKPMKEAFEEFMSTVEGKEIFDDAVAAEVAKQKPAKKPSVFSKETEDKIRAIADKLKIPTKGATGSYLIPPQLYNAAVDIITEAIVSGVKVARAVEKGIDYIIDNHKTGDPWKIKEFREDMKSQFGAVKAKPILTDELKEKILKRWRKKLSGLTEEQRRNLLQKGFDELMETGALDFDDFKKMYAEALGLKTMSDAMRTKLINLSKVKNKPSELWEELNKNPTEKGRQEYLKAVRESEKAAVEINELIAKEKQAFDSFITIMRLSLIGVKTLVVNVVYNFAAMPFRYAVFVLPHLAEAAKAGVQLVTDKALGSKYYSGYKGINLLEHQRKYWKGFAFGLGTASREAKTGITSMDYFQKEIKQNMHPWESAKRFIRIMTKKERASLSTTLNTAVEGLAGWYAEAMARGLNFGDKPFRYAAEYAYAEILAQKQGLSGIAKEVFIVAPDEVSEQKIKDYGAEITFQQKNAISGVMDDVSRFLSSKMGDDKSVFKKLFENTGKFIRYTNVPFLNTLINVFYEYILITNPVLAAGKMGFDIKNGDTQGAYKNGSRLIIGLAVQYVAITLVRAGLITPDDGDDESKREREGKKNYQKGASLNYDGLKRLLAGQDPSYRDGDSMIELKAYGFMGMALVAKANQYENNKKELTKETNFIFDILNAIPYQLRNGLTDGVFGNIGLAMNAISMGGRAADNYWMQLMQVAVPVPQVISAASRANDKFVRDTRGMTLSEELKNKLKAKFFMSKDLPVKRNMWGDPIERVPDNKNPWMWEFFSINRGSTIDQDKFGFVLYDLYNKSGDPKLFPTPLERDISDIPLTPQQYDQLSEMVGRNRKQMVEAYVQGNNLELMGKDLAIAMLQQKYKAGYQIGLMEFMQANPTVQNELLMKKLNDSQLEMEWNQTNE